jgi:hypothetical protein
VRAAKNRLAIRTTWSAVLAILLSSACLAGDVVEWIPRGISSDQFESHPAFDPVTGDFYFVRSSPAFTGWRILTSRCESNGWSKPTPPSFAADGAEADPYFTVDGKSLYFISTRSTDGIRRKDLDIWRVDRNIRAEWGTPQRLPEPVNSTATEWFPRPASDGWLYFGSSRPGGLGGNDIYRAREDRPQHWRVENLGATINTAKNEYEPLPSADAKALIVMADGGFYKSSKTVNGWAPRVLLDKTVNATGSEIGALYSPSGNSLLFARDLKDHRSGEFFVWYIKGHEAWPPQCLPKH